MKEVDILKDWCGVSNYDLDDQEVAAINEKYRQAPVRNLLKTLSYSSSFIAEATKAAAASKIRRAFWALARYDFAYDPARVRAAVAADPVFLGVFEWNDDEADLKAIYG